MDHDRLQVTYLLTCAEGEEPSRKARGIAFEQTAELPENCVPTEIVDRTVGRVEALEALDPPRYEARISYDLRTVGHEIPQLFNLLFGNISLQQGILISSVDWPRWVLERYRGPRFGIDGLRRLCGVDESRPLICAALKPLGLSVDDLAGICGELARGGVDIIKDDHGLTDQPSAPFHERVARCQTAVERANAATGGNSLYFPNLACGPGELESRLARIRSCGCRGILISPLLVGPDTVRWISDEQELAILTHPALSGAFFHDSHGIAPEVLLGQLFRIIGGDGVIYPNAGGRFPFSAKRCDRIHRALRAPLGSIRPAFPVPAGGIAMDRVSEWVTHYGPDTIFLVGGSLYAQGELARAGAALLRSVRTASDSS